MALYKKEVTKAHCGPGGIKCPCCSSGRNSKKAKQTHNRIIRRRSKKDFQKHMESKFPEFSFSAIEH